MNLKKKKKKKKKLLLYSRSKEVFDMNTIKKVFHTKCAFKVGLLS